MTGFSSSNGQVGRTLKALDRRAKQILRARPAYREMVEFYLAVFRCQIEWRPRLMVHPGPVDDEQWRACRAKRAPLIQAAEAGIEPGSLLELWAEMKPIFRRGNPFLGEAVGAIDRVEQSGTFTPVSWLAEQRPERGDLVSETSRRLGLEEAVLGSLTRAVTFPHWQQVSRVWLSGDRARQWRHFCCPVCGAAPALGEVRCEPAGETNLTPAVNRFLHCAFCGSRWTAPGLTCPHCESNESGEAKYYYSTKEADLRIDFCNACRHYLKVVKAEKNVPALYVGLELLTCAHLDEIAQEKDLSPLELCAQGSLET